MNILIVEDESKVAKRVERMVREIMGKTLQSLTHIETLNEALKFIEKESPDLLLLDLNLNGESGFDLLKTVVAKSFHTIIISAYKEQAITAFEYGVLDFVPKPFNKKRLEEAFNRVSAKDRRPANTVKYLAVKKKNKTQLISIDNVLYVKGAGSYSELFLSDGSKELHDKSLENLEQLLSPDFYRVHKSYLVKMSEIMEIIVESGSKYMLELKNETLIPIGRTKYKDLKKRWT